jgi:hypothetical protein
VWAYSTEDTYETLLAAPLKVNDLAVVPVEYTGPRVCRVAGDITLARRFHPDHKARNE